MSADDVAIELRGAPGRILDDLESDAAQNAYLVAGPAGTGKTFGIMLLFHLLACEYPGSRWLFARKTRESCTQSILETFENDILRTDGYTSLYSNCQRRNRSSYLYPNESEIVVGGFDKPTKILSSRYSGAYCAEALELEEEDVQILITRLNRPGSALKPSLLIFDCNPGDPAHFLKKRADRGKITLLESRHEDNPALHDGDDWTEEGRIYRESLSTLDGVWRKRLFTGLWTAGPEVWFEHFELDRHVSTDLDAEFDPALPVYLAIDPGVHTAAVFFQINPYTGRVRVFADYYAEGRDVTANAGAILELARALCGGRLDRIVMDPAAGARTGFGKVLREEYALAGLPAEPWPMRAVTEGLNLIGAFLSGALVVHGRCEHLINAFANYKRKKVRNQFIDAPEDPQHPYEDLMDALRGGLIDKFPDGRRPGIKAKFVKIRDVI